MLINPYQAQYAPEAYERQVSAHLLKRAILKARADHANAMADLVGQG